MSTLTLLSPPLFYGVVSVHPISRKEGVTILALNRSNSFPVLLFPPLSPLSSLSSLPHQVIIECLGVLVSQRQ